MVYNYFSLTEFDQCLSYAGLNFEFLYQVLVAIFKIVLNILKKCLDFFHYGVDMFSILFLPPSIENTSNIKVRLFSFSCCFNSFIVIVEPWFIFIKRRSGTTGKIYAFPISWRCIFERSKRFFFKKEHSSSNIHSVFSDN